MRFIVLVHEEPAADTRISEEQRAELDDQVFAYVSDLERSGKLIAGGPIETPEKATVIRSNNGELSMTDGPYVETKEHLAGFLLIEVADRDEALKLAAQFPRANYGSIEVRHHWKLQEPKRAEG
jgi:hypothetical protein